jgi:AraC-like DNA-binding protein
MRKHENGVISMALSHGGRALDLSVTVTVSGCYPVVADVSYIHPAPSFNRLFVFVRGGGELRIEGVTPCRLVPGNLFLMPAGQTFVCDYQQGSEFIYFHFELADAFGLELLSDLPPGVLRLAAPELAAEIVNAYQRQELEGMLRAQAGAFDGICQLIAPLFQDREWRMAVPAKYRAAFNHAVRHSRASLTVKELAQVAGVSRGVLSKWLQRETGIPVKEYLARLLMQKALRLVGGTDKTAKEIAVELGFDDPLYFFRLFKRRTGRTPMAYRAAVMAGAYEPAVPATPEALPEGH